MCRRRILKGRKTYIFHHGKLHTVRTAKTPRPISLRWVPPPQEITMTAETTEKPARPEVIAVAEK
ncbi:MAG: hypothetical protein QXX57_06155, partial [Nitrososphaerota archaeon]